MCREGGCGACVVTLQFTHPATGEEKTVSVNSCLFPVYACHGLKVITVEGIGNKKEGFNEVQTRLANFNGSQCGYCSPGWVMSMYSLLEANPKLTMKEIEDSFSGNLCRCTGYRPILDAFKSFAADRTEELEQRVEDIEDLLKICKRSGTPCHGKCQLDKSKHGVYECMKNDGKDEYNIDFLEVALALPSIRLELKSGPCWYKVATVNEIFEVFGMVNGSYRLLGGNTAQGILKYNPLPDVYIDVNGVGFLKTHSFYSNNLHIGGNTTLSDAIELFNAVADENPGYFSYTKELAKHIERVANTPVRNVGTIAGNLMLKHQWPAFQSDIFLILETVGARVSIRGGNEAITLLSLSAFLETDMYKKVILQVILPPLECTSYVVRTFKVAPRAQNALAYVNGGFKFKVNRNDRFRVIEQPNIVFGGINPSFIHAFQTERYLLGKRLLDIGTLQSALNILGKEVNPDYKLPNAKPEFRRKLTQALLYRVVLGLNPRLVAPKLRSGGENISRPVSSGKQEYQSDPLSPPLYQPFLKMDSLALCSGEAEFVYDIPALFNELYAALVITKKGPALIERLDPSRALKIPGVVAFFSARDIPGKNTFTPANPFIPDDEQLFAEKAVLFAGQPVGILVARTQEIADFAADFVNIVYTESKKPVLDVREVVKNKDSARIVLRASQEVVAPKLDVEKVVKGEFKMDAQYHFTMETLTCVTIPVEDGLDVYCTTQWLQVVQESIALVLNIPENSINMKLRRVGGGYGGKITRSALIASAVSLAAHLLHRPVRMVMKLETVMEAIGKRYTCLFNYEAGVNNEGEIQYLNTNLYEDAGSSFNDPVTAGYTFPAFTNVYDPSTWGTMMYDVKTDKPSSVWFRAPGTLEGVTMAEHIMEHIAFEVSKDPVSVRIKNLDQNYPTEKFITLIEEKSNYKSRKAQVDKFNYENIWKKRGISLVPIRFFIPTSCNYHATVSIYRNDGTIAICHGGVEVGQGINIKAAQVCASIFNVPLEIIKVKPTNILITPNDELTGCSITSESVCYAVERCCKKLNERLSPIRESLVSATWPAVIQAAYLAQIDLNASYMFTPTPTRDYKEYNVFGATVLEVEVDILTGEHKIIRVDILEDVGKSLNPLVDIGQIEGAFVMGLGYWTSEELIYDPNTGKMLTNRTLTYEIPGAKDIPIDFRVYVLKNGDNPLGVLRTKAVGEPPICMSQAIMFAIRQALRSVRQDLKLPDKWLHMDAPFTGENIFLNSGVEAKHYVLS